MLGDDWVQIHRRVVQQHANQYKRISWAKVWFTQFFLRELSLNLLIIESISALKLLPQSSNSQRNLFYGVLNITIIPCCLNKSACEIHLTFNPLHLLFTSNAGNRSF